MNLIKKLLLVISIFTFASIANAQSVKPKFKELTVAVYEPNDSAKNLAVTINLYYHINADGMIHIIMDRMSISNGRVKNFTGLISDTTYRLADSVIRDINTIFNGGRKLSSYMVIPKPTKGTSLLVRASFMSYVALNGTTDKMVFGDDFFGRDMNIVLNRIYFARQARTERNTGVYHNKALEAEILKEHLACKCITPVSATPPKVSHLELNGNR